jgi:hypothetical protein
MTDPHGGRGRLRGFVWLTLIPAVLLVLVIAPAGSAGPNTKNYTATLVPSSTISGGAGATLRITNLSSSTQSLGSVNAAFAGFTPAQGPVPAANVVVSNPAKTWSATVVGNTIQLRNPGPNTTNALAPGEYVQVTVTGPTAAGSYPITTQAKQSNDFNGAPGNDFARIGPDPILVVLGLDHFVWTIQPGSPQQAGVSFGAQVTAYDSLNQVVTGYTGTGAALSGLGTSPGGNAPSYALSWSGGVGTATVTDYRAETTKLTVTDGAVSQQSASFTVAPGPLAVLAMGSIAGPVTAGTPFNATITASDAYGNTKTDYNGSPAFALSGLGTSPGLPKPPYATAVAGTPPTYPAVSWSNGVGTATGVVATGATPSTKLTASDTVGIQNVSGSSNTFAVVAGAPANLAFSNQPTMTVAGQSIDASSGGVQVQVRDAYGNLIDGAPVTVTLDASSPAGGTLSGTTTKSSVGGTATYTNLSIDKPNVGYVLRATSGAASVTSNPFVISNSTTNCNGSSCSGSASIQKNTTLNVAATGTTSATQLGIALVPGATPPAGACPGFVPAIDAPGSYINVVGPNPAQPSIVVTWTLDKTVVNEQPENGVAHYNVCLGAINLLGATTGYTTKNGTLAVPIFDPAFGQTFFWGVLQDCPAVNPTDPCVVSRTKTGSGNAVITFQVPYPWDANGWLG